MSRNLNIRGLNEWTGYLRTESARIGQLGEKVAEEAAEYGKELMRKNIMTSGTGYVGRGKRAIPGGRIDTGVMHDAVEAGDVKKTQRGWSTSFGWINVREPYFLMQEHGTYNVPNPTPMFAFVDAVVRTREWFYARVRDEVNQR